MPDPEPTQLEKLKTKRLWLLYAAILCSLLVSLTFWLKRDSGDFDKRADAIGAKMDRLSKRLAHLAEEQEQLENDVSEAKKEKRADHFPGDRQARFASIAAECEQISREIENLNAEIASLKTRISSSPPVTRYSITVSILVGLQLIFLIAYLTSPQKGALNGSENHSSPHDDSALN